MSADAATAAVLPIIWILEDDPGMQFLYGETFLGLFAVCAFRSIKELRRAVSTLSLAGPTEAAPALILGDIGLPDGSFLEFLSAREAVSILHIPVLIVSSIDDTKILRLAFRKGVTDFIVKPFSANEMLVKVERICRAAMSAPPDVTSVSGVPDSDGQTVGLQHPSPHQVAPLDRLSYLGLHLDPIARTVVAASGLQELTPREFQVLLFLVRVGAAGITKDELARAVWADAVVSPKNIEVQLANLRKKLASLSYTVSFSHPFYSICICQDSVVEDGSPAKVS